MSDLSEHFCNREVIATMALLDVSKVSPPADPAPRNPVAEKQDPTLRISECMKIALRHSLSNISVPEKQRALDPRTDFTIKTKFVHDPTSTANRVGCCSASATRVRTRGPKIELREPFVFTDYSPMCYRHIREFFTIDAKAFEDVLCNSNWHATAAGKSSAQLFFCGQNWVIKTMTKEESKFLREILHRYYYHVRDNAYTLLPHFVGHHSLHFEGRKITFVIMQNVFATPQKITEKYDLKGSTVGRYAQAEEKEKVTWIRKDLDINRPIFLGEHRRQLFIDQIKRDTAFLRTSEIMDYSLLVGIHFNDGAATLAPSEVEDERCFTADDGGMHSSPYKGRPAAIETYYVGIIDILQKYNGRKRAETLLKGIAENSSQISCIKPTDYANRFIAFMSWIVV